MTRSPLAPARFPDLPPVRGVRLASRPAGIRYRDRDDIMLATVPPGTTTAGVFTTSRCPAAPVDWCRTVVARGTTRALLCNSGNANAFTGRAGAESTRSSAQLVADQLGAEPAEVLLSSTGVIGEPLLIAPIKEAVPALVAELVDSGPAPWAAAATAITTTDTFPKGSWAAIDGTDCRVVGIAKGSGMIAPDMATMLAFVFTDVAVAAPLLHELLIDAVDSSFHQITVDSDTSTSDTVLALATPGTEPITSVSDPRARALGRALGAVCLDLAHQVVRDGEGATKFVTVNVRGAASEPDARTLAFAIADSPLVKTALAAADANWGRIVMAVGKAGVAADRDALAIWLGDEQCARAGAVHPDYDEARATAHLRGEEVELTVDVGVGGAEATVWTCDLTHGYIDINAGYRT